MSKSFRDKKRWRYKNGVESPYPAWPDNTMSSWFKVIRKRIRRHKAKMALRNGREIPRFRNDNLWWWW